MAHNSSTSHANWVPPALLDEASSFQSLCPELDRRVLKAISKLGYIYPTLVQKQAIPLALEGKDLLVKAKTGSGKTAAYSIPLIHKILKAPATPGVKALILVPTRELCDQTREAIKGLTYYCAEQCKVIDLAGGHMQEQIAKLKDGPDIIVATPSKLVQHLKDGRVVLRDTLQTLVIDEADLVLLNGYGDDIRTVIHELPTICQTFLMSATLSSDLEELKRTVLHSAAILKLEEGTSDGHLTQFVVSIAKNDKYLLLYALIKLGLIAGKAIFFVNDIDACYRLKLFLEKFSIPCAVLNAELPANSRLHCLAQFNKGIFDYLIATDESVGPDSDSAPEAADAGEDSDAQPSNKKPKKDKHGKKGKKGKDGDFGVARGVDFKGVSTVINVDMPPSAEAYTHRIGRTARAGASGVALTFVLSGKSKEADVLREIQDTQPVLDDGRPQPVPLPFNLTEIEPFRYRIEDVQRKVTSILVRDARLAELKHEMLASDALKAHFEDNPRDLAALRHDKPIVPSQVLSHLAHVPAYLVPMSLQAAASAAGGGLNTDTKPSKKRSRPQAVPGSSDPLKSFAYNAQRLGGAIGSAKVAGTYTPVGESTSGRRQWQIRHKRGQWNPKNRKGKSGK